MHGKPNEQFSLNTGGYSPNIIVNSSNICFAYFFLFLITKQNKTKQEAEWTLVLQQTTLHIHTNITSCHIENHNRNTALKRQVINNRMKTIESRPVRSPA